MLATPADKKHLSPGSRVSTPDGDGEVKYVTADGWYGVRIDAETTTHEWPSSDVKAVRS